MFDNLREQADSTPFYEDEAAFLGTPTQAPAARRRAGGGLLLGMTPMQRFIVAVMLLIAICALGSMCLLITGRIGLG
jgi:hypothetical protein